MAERDRMTKVLHLQSSLGFYGAENVIANLCTAMHEEFTPIIGVLDNQYNSHCELTAFAHENQISTVTFPCQAAFDLRTVRQLRTYLKNNKIQIVNTHGYKSNFYARAATLGSHIAIVATCHPWILTTRRGRRYATIDRYLLRSFNHVVAVSSTVVSDLLASGIPSSKITLIPNGIDFNRFTSRDEAFGPQNALNLPEDKTIIGSVGRLDPEKGHFVLLQAAQNIIRACPDVHFVIAGTGSLENSLRDQIKALDLTEYVTLAGFVQDMTRFLQAIDLFTLPSLTEGMPMAVLEALAANKPVVATRVGDIPDLIEHQVSGMLVQPNNAHQLQSALLELIRSPDKARKMAQRAYKKTRNRYSAQHMAAQYQQLYRTANGQTRRPSHIVRHTVVNL
jgi:glycosyltransferase involved in cell wall biosynthesis